MAAVAELSANVAKLSENVARLLEGQKRQDKRLDVMSLQLRDVEKVTQMGKGIGWAILRIGAFCALAVGLWEWARSYL